MPNEIISGMKYFKLIDNSMNIIRITSGLNPMKIRAKNIIDGKNIFLNKDELKTYTRLNPDALIQFSIVKVHELEDVIITLYRYKKEVLNKDNTPYCICRQNVTDFFKNALSNKTYYGISISKDTVPPDVEYEKILSCDGIIKTKSIAVYMDDKLKDILSFIKPKEYDNALYSLFYDYVKYLHKNDDEKDIKTNIKSDMESMVIDGYCKTLKELLEYNNFMYDFHRGFDIYPLNIDLSYIDNGSSVLSVEHMNILKDILCKNIYATIVLRFSKDIDLSKIDKDYVLISDIHENLYVVSYRHRGKYYIPIERTESYDNIEKLSSIIKSPDSSVQHAINSIRINSKKYI